MDALRIPGCRLVRVTVVLVCACTAGRVSGQRAKGEFPCCHAIHIESPDRRWELGSKCTINCPPGEDKNWDKAAVPLCSDDPNNELFLEDTSTHRKRPIAFDGYDGNSVWSPDSAAFFVNDHIASDETDSALYIAHPFKRIDVDDAIRQFDPAAAPYFRGHRYFYALRWLDNRTVLVRLCGHSDNAPFVQFDFHYRVGLDGKARRISRRITRPQLSKGDCE